MTGEPPTARIGRVRGVLDGLTVRTCRLALRLDDGSVLHGSFVPAAMLDRLKGLLGTPVVLEGRVSFDPSGAARSIAVESVMRAAPGDVIWSRRPKVEFAPPASPPENDLDAFFGTWPGDETDEELAAAMRDMG